MEGGLVGVKSLPKRGMELQIIRWRRPQEKGRKGWEDGRLSSTLLRPTEACSIQIPSVLQKGQGLLELGIFLSTPGTSQTNVQAATTEMAFEEPIDEKKFEKMEDGGEVEEAASEKDAQEGGPEKEAEGPQEESEESCLERESKEGCPKRECE